MCGHVADLTDGGTALFRVRALGEERSASDEARRLVLQGRTFLITCECLVYDVLITEN